MRKHCLRLTVLCENSVQGPFGLIGEHGWSILAEIRGRRILFDTGQGIGIINNSMLLGIELSNLDMLVLSHGHYDHASGIPQVARLNRSVKVICHEDVFLPRYWVKGGIERFIGMIHRREYLESLGCRFTFYSTFKEIVPGVFVTGEVPRVTDFEHPDPNMQIETGSREGTSRSNRIQDPLRDDLSMIIDTPKGLVVVLGCAHAGLINILSHVRNNLPGKRIHTVIGGTHLGFANKTQFEITLKELKRFEIKRLGASHCTGLSNAARLAASLGDKFFHAGVGLSLQI